MGKAQKRQREQLKRKQLQIQKKEKEEEEQGPWVPPNPPKELPNIHGRTIEYDFQQETLPEGWEYRVLRDGRILYVNLDKGLSQFQHPSNDDKDGMDHMGSSGGALFF